MRLRASLPWPSTSAYSNLVYASRKMSRLPPPQKKDQKQQQKQKQRQNRGSAVQLLVKSNVQLKLNGFLS
jgi:hypothetical protein